MRKRQVKYLWSLVLAVAGLTSWIAFRATGTVSKGSPPLTLSSWSASPLSEPDPATPRQAQGATQARLVGAYGKLPLSFEANQGQTDRQVKFLSRGQGYTLFLTSSEAVLTLRKAERSRRKENRDAKDPSLRLNPSLRFHRSAFAETVLRMKLVGAHPEPQMEGLEELPGKSNYFLGNDPKKWQLQVPTYAKVKYKEVYAGVDLVYYGNQQQLEYDFVVAPGADPKVIQLAFEGAEGMETDSQGDLILHTGVGEVRLQKPRVYQEIHGIRKLLPGNYLRLEPGTWDSGPWARIGFEVAAYETSKPLIIDPVLSYSTFLGGGSPDVEITGGDNGSDIAVDTAGNAYIIGSTSSINFPMANPLQSNFRGSFFKSANSGGSWSASNRDLTGGIVNTLAIDPINPSILYAGTVGGVSKSLDGGNSWNAINTGIFVLPGYIISSNALAVDPQTSSTLYTGTDFGVFKSLNGGTNWVSMSQGIPMDPFGFRFVDALAIDPTNPATIYAGTFTGVYKSTNGGVSWEAVNQGLSIDLNFLAYTLAMDPTTPSTLYVGTTKGVYKSVDGGSSWKAINRGLTDSSGSVLPVFALAIDPITPSTLYAGGIGVFKSLDGGSSWSAINTGLINPLGSTADVRALAVDPTTPSTLYTGTDFGVFKSVDGGGSWSVSLAAPVVNALVLDPANPSLIYVGTLGGFSDAFVVKLNSTGSALVYSTYLGGSHIDRGSGIAVDSEGNVYVTGGTRSIDFPVVNPLQVACAGPFCEDSFVAKLNATGSALVYSTYLGGSGNEEVFPPDIAVDPSGNAYVIGATTSSDFPTVNPLQAQLAKCAFSGFHTCDDAFVSKLNATGSAFVYSTYLGGNDDDIGTGIAVDTSGDAYVAGFTSSTNFPTVNPLQAKCAGSFCNDVFVAKLNAMGSALIYSTYLGGSNGDGSSSTSFLARIAVDPFGNAYVTGSTTSTDFPTANPLQTSCAGPLSLCRDIFVTKMNPTGSALVYSTYLGGSDVDDSSGIALDASGNVYVTGTTTSTDFPTTVGAPDVTCGTDGLCNSFPDPDTGLLTPIGDAFVTKIAATGFRLIYSTYLGGSKADPGNGIAVDVLGNAYVTGFTNSSDFPTANPLLPACSLGKFVCSDDGFISKIIDPAIPLAAAADYNGDHKADLTLYRPSTGEWFVFGTPGVPFGSPLDLPTPGDYDGDGKADFAFFRPAPGEWHVLLEGVEEVQNWGQPGDRPIPGDYDGDGKTDRAVWRPLTGQWWILLSGGGFTVINWGGVDDVPVPADYDGDGKTDVAVFRPSTGQWFLLRSSGGLSIQTFGESGDAPVPGDYDGDGRANIAIWRPRTGLWKVLLRDGRTMKKVWGIPGDFPVQADYDGDGKTDQGIFRGSGGQWFILTSSSRFTVPVVMTWGSLGDIPVSASGGK